jgi:DNA polymerase-3 subunit delta'
VRPESKSRVILIEQMRDLMQEINLKPNDAEYKVAIIVAADRLNVNAANAFLKTLEEPPAKSVIILLSTEPQRLLETILSRCLRLNFGGDGKARFAPEQLEWLGQFSEMASTQEKSLLGRYRLLDGLAQRLAKLRETVEEALTARSPLARHDDVEKDLREKWEEELKAAIEAEYRRHRADILAGVHWWLRDVWLHTLKAGAELVSFPQFGATAKVAGRITPPQALENLRVMEQTQRLLHSNVQETLALEVGLLKTSVVSKSRPAKTNSPVPSANPPPGARDQLAQIFALLFGAFLGWLSSSFRTRPSWKIWWYVRRMRSSGRSAHGQ